MDSFPVMGEQDGVISRGQVFGAGGNRHDVDRLLRRRVWARLLPATYVNHTGTPTWRQSMWSAYLATPGSALADDTVLALAGLLPETLPIHLAIPLERRRRELRDVVIHRVKHFDAMCIDTLRPRRLRLEPALLRVAERRPDAIAALDLVVDAVRTRRTTVHRVQEEMACFTRLRYREFLALGIEEAGSGMHSALERAYGRDVERRHGLPPGNRQSRSAVGGVVYRDVEYEQFGLIVELDGAQGHSSPRDRRADMDRDLRSTADGGTTIRLGAHHVFRTPCITASWVARCLRARGWNGQPEACAPGCILAVEC
jgi:hypothetical protein